MTRLSGQRALVTGASSGIGTEIARKLAAEGAHLVITARREARLESLAAEVREAYSVEVDIVAVDLAEPDAPQILFDATEGATKPIDILVNNAGLGVYDHFVDVEYARHGNMLSVNVVALTHLTHLFANAMVGRGVGRIMNIASCAAYTPCPNFAAYGATKAYVRNFTEALDYELEGTGVSAIVINPGGVLTEFSDRGGQKLKKGAQSAMMTAEECADIAVEKMLDGRRTVITGFMNALSMWLFRFFPRAWQPRVMDVTMRSVVDKAPPSEQLPP